MCTCTYNCIYMLVIEVARAVRDHLTSVCFLHYSVCYFNPRMQLCSFLVSIFPEGGGGWGVG